MQSKWPMVKLGEVLETVSRPEIVVPEKEYKILGAKWYVKGLYVKSKVMGTEIKAKKLFMVKEGDFVYNRLFAWKGSFALVSRELDGCYVSNEYPTFLIDTTRLNPKYLLYFFSREHIWNMALQLSMGVSSISRNRLKVNKFLEIEIPLPPLEEQERIVAKIEALVSRAEEARRLRAEAVREAEEMFLAELNHCFIHLLKEYPLTKIKDIGNVVRGKGPVYFEGSGAKIINQKCIRWNYINLEYAKDIDLEWLKKLNSKFLAEEGDILVNSTGEGTIGRAAVVSKKNSKMPFDSHVLAIKINKTKAISEYIFYFIKSPNGQSKIEDIKGANTTKQTELGVKKLGNILFPLPPLPVQRRIVAYLDSLQAKVDELKRLQEETEKEIEELVPSILNKAFKGEL